MLFRSATAILMVLCFSAAHASDEYYIGLSSEKARCQLLEIPPETTSFKLLADGRVFFEKGEAQDVLAALPECKLARASASSDPAGAKELSSSAREASRRVRRSIHR